MKTLLALVLAILTIGAFAWAEDKAKEKAGDEMPPMGAPEEMKQLDFLVGDWKAATRWRLDYTKDEWVEYEAKCRYSLIIDGSAIKLDYDAEIMGMTMKGISIMTFDRETRNWQMTWLDNMTARNSIYTGDRIDRKMTVTGQDFYGEKPVLTRITSWDETDTSFKWKLEQSMDGGKTWLLGGQADYTKQ